MTTLLRLAINLLGGARASVFCTLWIGATVVLIITANRLDTARGYLSAELSTSAQLRESIRSNLQVIADLEAANKAWSDAARDQQARAELEIQQARAERDAATAELSQRRQARGAIYERDPSAAEWGRTRVPRDILAGLRD